MTQTVVYDQHENTKAIMNAINAFARHCRIGKVRPKTVGDRLIRSASQARDMVRSWERSTDNWPVPFYAAKVNESGFMPKCGRRIGNACRNVVCPHAPVAT